MSAPGQPPDQDDGKVTRPTLVTPHLRLRPFRIVEQAPFLRHFTASYGPAS